MLTGKTLFAVALGVVAAAAAALHFFAPELMHALGHAIHGR